MLPLQACGSSYSAKAIEGWVVDADTKKPLEGVNVVAHWVLAFGMEGGQSTDLVLMESVTDNAGRYSFPAWGPVRVHGNLPWEARLKNQDPEIIFFKSGHGWDAVSNRITGPYPDAGPRVRSSEWNGKTVELKKIEGNLDRYGSIVSGVLTGVSYGRCSWKQMPRMLVALDRESQRLRQQKILTFLPTIDKIRDISVGENCGPVEEFFKGYQK